MADPRPSVRQLLDLVPPAAETPRLALLDFDVVMRVPDDDLARYLTDLYAPLAATGEAEHVLTLSESAGGHTVHLDATRLLETPARSIAFRTLLWEANRQAIDRTRGNVLIHASAAAREGLAVLLPGPMGAGKSTVVAGLVRAGLEYLTDEVVALDPATGRVRPYPKYLSLGASPVAVPDPSPAVREFVGDQTLVPPDVIRVGAAAREAAVARIVVMPRYQPGTAAALELLRPAEALAALAEHTFHLEEDGPLALAVLASVVEQSRCYRLISGDVDGATRAVLALIDEVCAPVRT